MQISNLSKPIYIYIYIYTGNKSIAFTVQPPGGGGGSQASKEANSYIEINTPEHVLKIDCSVASKIDATLSILEIT